MDSANRQNSATERRDRNICQRGRIRFVDSFVIGSDECFPAGRRGPIVFDSIDVISQMPQHLQIYCLYDRVFDSCWVFEDKNISLV